MCYMSDDQFTQLSRAIQTVGNRLEATEKRFDDQFTKLFQYMERRFQVVEERLDKTALKEDVDRLANAVDAFARRMEVYDHERLALGNQVDRHERWHHQTAQAIGLNLHA